jgi:hypothetical protein
VIPALELDRVVEPIQPQPWKPFLETREARRVQLQEIDAHERSARWLVREPARPGRKGAGLVGDAANELQQCGPDRNGRALLRRDVAIHEDHAAHWQSRCQLSRQDTCGAVADDHGVLVGIDMIQQVPRPPAPAWWRGAVGQYVGYLHRQAGLSQTLGCRQPACGPNWWAGDEDVVRLHVRKGSIKTWSIKTWSIKTWGQSKLNCRTDSSTRDSRADAAPYKLAPELGSMVRARLGSGQSRA